MTVVEVAVVAPLPRTLTYTWPDRFAVPPQPGQRYLVPLGRRRVTGYCLGETADLPDTSLKEVAEVLSAEPFFPPGLVSFYRWIADYYHYPIGGVIEEALPGGLTMKSSRFLELDEEGRKELEKLRAEKESLDAWAEELLAAGSLPPARLKVLLDGETGRLIRQWQRRGLVRFVQKTGGSGVRPRMETVVRLLPANPLQGEPDGPPLKKSEQKTLALLAELTAEQVASAIARRQLTGLYSGAAKALAGLVEKGLIALEEQRLFRDPFGLAPPFYPRPGQLTVEQRQVLDVVLPLVQQKKFAPVLLHGITGSGKTEVYLRAAEEAIAIGRSVLVLVPEIALATQLEGHFYSRFGDLTALLHSGLSRGEKLDEWQRIANGSAKVVIGARSAIFAPLADLGLIVVDEEHDGAYKQEEGLRYQARDLAVLRAKMQNATVLLGSATPSVISFMHARQGKYRLVSMTRRIEDRPLPEVTVVNLKGAAKTGGGRPLFSEELLAALTETFERGEQTLLFLNRRGFASLLICKDCGFPVQCKNCQISLTLHKVKNQLVCHHCGYARPAAALCPHCRGGDMLAVGFGTERIEEELAAILPAARLSRLDRDTIVKRRDYYAILNKVRQHQVDVLIGTQMITKGHHFPLVTLVGILWADAGLGMPDYKAGERTFQLLSQVMGRAGRGDRPGKVIVQTYQPDHYGIECARRHDYEKFFELELALRRGLQYPPFSRLINFLFEGPEEQRVAEAAAAAGLLLQKAAARRGPIQVLGPAPLLRLGGKFRWQLLLCGASVEKLHGACAGLLAEPPLPVRSRQVRMVVDVDPEGML